LEKNQKFLLLCREFEQLTTRMGELGRDNFGSGVIEAGCKTIIGQRLKQSGMEWSVRGANAIITLRCLINSDRFEDYWDSCAA
jgi:hypothetical protein